MKTRTFTRIIGAACLALCPLAAAAQRTSMQPSPAQVKSSGLLLATKDTQSEERRRVAAKRMNVDRHALEPNASALVSSTPDLTITNVGTGHDPLSGNMVHIIVVENTGKADAAPCTLRFMYGMTWDSLESTDLSVPGIPAGKSAKITFTPPAKQVHWWLFGVDVDNKLKEANFSNNVYLVEFKD